MAGLDPTKLLQEAIKAVPALKYALGIVGVVSAIAIVASLGISFQVAVFGTIVMLLLMTLLVVFSKLTTIAPPLFVTPVLVFMWSSLVLTIATALLLFSSVFFRWPVDLHTWIASGPIPPTTSAPRQTEEAHAKEHQAQELVTVGKQQQERQQYAEAWKSFTQAATLAPSAPDVRTAQEDLAMDWLRNIVLNQDQQFSDIINQIEPTLDRGILTATEPSRKADLQAHLGWAMFLRTRDGEHVASPESAYQKAVSFDPHNPYAHAMLGHWLLWNNGDAITAKQHFDAALASGRAEEYVRTLQLAALANSHNDILNLELVRVANDMRKRHPETKPDARYLSDIWGVYYFALTHGSEMKQLVQIIPPDEHLTTLHWLFDEDFVHEEGKRQTLLYYVGLLQEASGRPTEARQTLKTLSQALAGQAGTLAELTQTALKRLGK